LENCNLRQFLVGVELFWSMEGCENVHKLAEMVKSLCRPISRIIQQECNVIFYVLLMKVRV